MFHLRNPEEAVESSGILPMSKAKIYFESLGKGYAKILVTDNHVVEECGDPNPVQWCYDQACDEHWIYDNAIVYWYEGDKV